jgi:hypothetical protein
MITSTIPALSEFQPSVLGTFKHIGHSIATVGLDDGVTSVLLILIVLVLLRGTMRLVRSLFVPLAELVRIAATAALAVLITAAAIMLLAVALLLR